MSTSIKPVVLIQIRVSYPRNLTVQLLPSNVSLRRMFEIKIDHEPDDGGGNIVQEVLLIPLVDAQFDRCPSNVLVGRDHPEPPVEVILQLLDSVFADVVAEDKGGEVGGDVVVVDVDVVGDRIGELMEDAHVVERVDVVGVKDRRHFLFFIYLILYCFACCSCCCCGLVWVKLFNIIKYIPNREIHSIFLFNLFNNK